MNTTVQSTRAQHALTFGSHPIKTITRDGQVWMSGTEIGRALEYAEPDTAIKKLFNRSADEFTSSMTKVIKVMTAGGKQAVRFFSLRGAHLLAMFARTEKAKAFRVWVLDILDREVDALRAQARSGAKLGAVTLETIQALCNEVQFIGSWWKHYGRGIEMLNPHAHNQIFERFLFAPGRAEEVVKDLGLRSARQVALVEKWEWTAKDSRQKAKMAARMEASVPWTGS